MKTVITHKTQSGVAVISAMLIAAFVTLIAAQWLLQQQMLINQLENHFAASQARRMSDAAAEWSRAILAEDQKSGDIDHLKEPWATRLPATPFENAVIQGSIIDQQGFCNLNNLSRSGAADAIKLKRFIQQLGGNEGLIDALADWIDLDFEVTQPDGAEVNSYLVLANPYKTANQPLTEIGNLSRVAGFNHEIISRLAQFCTVLPEPTPLNINTASAEVLALTMPGLNTFDIKAIIDKRNAQPFSSVAELGEMLEQNNPDVDNKRLSVNSQYFLVITKIQSGKTTINATTLMKKDLKGWPKTIWRRYS